MQDEDMNLAIGTTIRDPAGDQYMVESLLGQGGFGSVYLVRSRRFERSLFALKEMINPDKRDRERFLFEGEVLKRLHHWALPHVYRTFEHDKLKRVYMLMDYVQGKNLETLRREQPERRFSLPLALALMAPIVDALTYLHEQNPPIVHRDVKPSNIIVSTRADEAMLVDFGLAKEYIEEDTTNAVRHGSPGYAALEQYGSGTTPQTDIYSLGATLYTLLTGVIPVDAITRASASKGVDPLRPASLITPEVPPAIARTLQRAMSLSIDDRFSTIEEFWQELKANAPEAQSFAPSIPSSSGMQPANPFKQGVITTSSQWRKNTSHLGNDRTKRRVLWPVLFALLIIGVIGTSFLVYMQVNLPGLSSGLSAHIASATPTVMLTLTSTLTPGAATTPISAASAISGTYKGTLLDLTTNSSATMILTRMRQNQGRISGYIAFGSNGPAIQGHGPLYGTVNADNQIQFIVTDAEGHSLLFFRGVMQSPIHLNGDYYSCTGAQESQCTEAPGSYGMWNVTQAS